MMTQLESKLMAYTTHVLVMFKAKDEVQAETYCCY